MKKIYIIFIIAVISLLSANCGKSNETSSVTPPDDNENTDNPPDSSITTSPVGDVVGKVTVGYQGWFSAKGDGSPLNNWGHQNLEMWPDTRAYDVTYAGSNFMQAGVQQDPFYGNLRNGKPAKMFSSYDQQVINTHVQWMKDYGIDCAAIQRFASHTKPGSVLKAQRDGIDSMFRKAAEAIGIKFYIMYDCSATDDVEDDWTNTIINKQHLTASSAYAHQNGKPVVCLWGVGKPDRGKVNDWVETINWFKSQGCYVIGAPLGNWRTDVANQPAYNACDMIMPWAVGRTAGFEAWYAGDIAYCKAHGIDYQACAYPGFAFYNTNGSKSPKNQIPRKHGDFMWKQFALMKVENVRSVYVAMFDEMNEGTAIFKCAEDAGMIPSGMYFLTLDADGVHVSSDYYLRLVENGGKMIKGDIPYTATNPTPFE